ncbi:protein-L-isoaspartate O-methyltransferase [Hyphomicrobium nitrativorans NL23]|uniref:Protein-L-isoaspartate O-methyltransferase n=1 Tax=Hyphomicrobium nitrativorans NL23 TaxID=1029756 RepID=V5SHH2_9HYPH|nr:protein-L-isoaspartate(D-aspartate) O-methyltransferase [Hyphomicrobium nitrativorans]AHB49510.1 protein-L-isoaspartate O-methyltransferase [Hyphomicrobium nitrativorans NL23]
MTAIDDDMAARRAAMVREIEQTAAGLVPRFSLSPRVLAAMGDVPRHAFVLPEHLSDAYRNGPLPIGFGQTISQPFIVALMTDLAALKPGDRVLDIGTGSGYQAAILAGLVSHVFTIELCAPLAARAAKTFKDLGLHNITMRVGDGHRGWPEEAPFDAIVVAAAPGEIPEALIAQLKPGGRLVIPVGGRTQKLIVVEKGSDQSSHRSEIIPVSFVPLMKDDSAGSA